MNTVNIWTDGSCNNATHDKGGYGVVMEFMNESKKKFNVEYIGGSFSNTTSSRMELMGVISSLKRVTPNYRCLVHCDNRYVVDSFMKGWVFTWEKQGWLERVNKDLWIDFLKEYRKFPKNHIVLRWIKGHAKNKRNIRADQLASMGAKKRNKIIDKK